MQLKNKRRLKEKVNLSKPSHINCLTRKAYKHRRPGSARYRTDRISADPTDNKFLAGALEADAAYIVSGDNHLLALKHFHRIQIVDAATFIAKVEGK